MKSLSRLREHLTFLSMIAFLLIASHAVASVPQKTVAAPINYRPRTDLPLLPKLRDPNSVPVVSAQGVVAIDTASGVVLYEKNAQTPLSPASTTKIMTALTASDIFPLESEITVGNISTTGQRMRLFPGERLLIRDIIRGLLIFSANDAAETLAVGHPDGRDAFIAAMNIKARQLGMENTFFVNPSGLDSSGHVSTANDMAKLALAAMDNSFIAEVVATKSAIIKSTDGASRHYISNTNELLGTVDGVVGIKTGWTEAARENLLTMIERDGKRVLIVVLGSQDRFGETREIIDWVFSQYEWTVVMEPYAADSIDYSPEEAAAL